MAVELASERRPEHVTTKNDGKSKGGEVNGKSLKHIAWGHRTKTKMVAIQKAVTTEFSYTASHTARIIPIHYFVEI